MTQTKSVTAPKMRTEDKFPVGALVEACRGRLVYLLLPKDRSVPLRTGSGTVSGVVIFKIGELDADGDKLPEIGYVHTNLAENSLKLYDRAVQLWN